MRKILSCEFNLDTACVELSLDDGTLISIDCTAGLPMAMTFLIQLHLRLVKTNKVVSMNKLKA